MKNRITAQQTFTAAIAIAFCIALAFAINATIIADAQAELAQDTRAEATSLRRSLDIAESGITTLSAGLNASEATVASLGYSLGSKDIIIADLENVTAELRSELRTRPSTVSRSAPVSPITPAEGEHGGVWTRAKTEGVLAAACEYYDIGSDTDWLVAKGVHIVYDGAENRGGVCDLKNPSSSATGLFQFLKAWGTGSCSHGASDWRACGTCSCYRFVRVFSESGKSGIAGHWAATY